MYFQSTLARMVPTHRAFDRPSRADCQKIHPPNKNQYDNLLHDNLLTLVETWSLYQLQQSIVLNHSPSFSHCRAHRRPCGSSSSFLPNHMYKVLHNIPSKFCQDIIPLIFARNTHKAHSLARLQSRIRIQILGPPLHAGVSEPW